MFVRISDKCNRGSLNICFLNENLIDREQLRSNGAAATLLVASFGEISSSISISAKSILKSETGAVWLHL